MEWNFRWQPMQSVMRFYSASSPKSAAGLQVMDFGAGERAAELASPAVAIEDLFLEFLVGFGREPQALPILPKMAHEVPLTCLRKCCCCSTGTSLKIRSSEIARFEASGFSIVAAARKSAQVIRRQ
jgi:hypothetical protein